MKNKDFQKVIRSSMGTVCLWIWCVVINGLLIATTMILFSEVVSPVLHEAGDRTEEWLCRDVPGPCDWKTLPPVPYPVPHTHSHPHPDHVIMDEPS